MKISNEALQNVQVIRNETDLYFRVIIYIWDDELLFQISISHKKTIRQEAFFSFETFFGSYTISKLDRTSNPNVVENDGRMTYIDYVCNSPFVVL